MLSPNRSHDRQSFFKYTTAGTAHQILASRSLRWSSPTLFNDPWDVPREADLGFTTAELQAAIHADLLGVLEGDRGTKHARLVQLAGFAKRMPSGPQRSAMFDEIRQSLEGMAPATTDAFAMLRQVWAEMVPQLRMLCVSEVRDSPQMWAYYAENHTGVVLEFEASDTLDSPLLLARPVIYSDRPPALPAVEVWARALVLDEPIDWEAWLHEYHYLKHLNWQHEREWRAMTYADPGDVTLFTDRLFHPEELSGVYLGARMPPSDADGLRNLAAERFPRTKVFRGKIEYASRVPLFDPA